MREQRYTPVQGTVKHMTDRAVLLKMSGREIWVPNSVIFEDDLAGLGVGVIGEVNVADWFYEKNF